MSNREATFRMWTGGVVMALWAASVVVDMLVADYDPPSGLGPLVMVIVTSMFTKPVVEEIRRRGGDS